MPITRSDSLTGHWWVVAYDADTAMIRLGEHLNDLDAATDSVFDQQYDAQQNATLGERVYAATLTITPAGDS